MSWSGISNNQIVSDTNLADACNSGAFPAKTSIPSTGRMLTKTAAENYAYLVVDGGVASNELIKKSDLSQYKACTYGPYNQYVYATDGDRVYKSTNGGYTFSPFSLPYAPGNSVYTALAASATGQYVAVAGNGNVNVGISNDYGNTFTWVGISGSSPFSSFYTCDIDMSDNGQYIAVAGKTTSGSNSGQVTVAISNNYGVSFSVYTGSYSSNTWTRTSVAVSGDGSRMSYVALSSVNKNSIRYYSNNYGASWTSGGVSPNTLFTDVCLSYTGQYQMVINYGTNPGVGGQINVSNNYGSGFSVRGISGYPNGSGYLQYCGMSSSGAVMYATTDGNQLYGSSFISTDYGGGFVDTSSGIRPCYGAAVGNTFMGTSAKPYYCSFSSQYLMHYMPESNSYCTGQPLSQTYNINKVFRKSFSY